MVIAVLSDGGLLNGDLDDEAMISWYWRVEEMKISIEIRTRWAGHGGEEGNIR